MDVSEQKNLAERLRDQGFADLLAASDNRGRADFTIGGARVTSDHIVVSKCQQAEEKLVKAFFVWHGEPLNPFRGHAPLQDVLNGTGGNSALVERFRTIVRQENHFLNTISWIENLAPQGAPVSGSSLSNIDASELLRNCEYPFYDSETSHIVCPAEYFGQKDSIQALRVVYQLCKVIADSDDSTFGRTVKQFLDDYPLI